MSRSFVRFATPEAAPPLLIFLFSSTTVVAAPPTGRLAALCAASKASAVCWGGFDAEEVKHSVPSHPGKFRQKQVIFIAGDGAENFISSSLHLLRINNCNAKRHHHVKKMHREECLLLTFFPKLESFAEV
jgi:hypothetical protein